MLIAVISVEKPAKTRLTFDTGRDIMIVEIKLITDWMRGYV